MEQRKILILIVRNAKCYDFEKSLAVFLNVKPRVLCDPTIPLLTVYQDRKLGMSTRDMHKSVHTGREIGDGSKAHLQESG